MKLTAHVFKPQVLAFFSSIFVLGVVIYLGQNNSYIVLVARRVLKFFSLNSYVIFPIIEYYVLRATVAGMFVLAFVTAALSLFAIQTNQNIFYNQKIVENNAGQKSVPNGLQKIHQYLLSIFAPPNISVLSLIIIATIGLTAIFSFLRPASAYAAAGIYERINFQGKLQNANGTNVSDGNYSIVFTLYDASSGGSNLWDETQTVAVADGVFQVELGAVDTSIGSVDFNSDTIYLGVKVEADAEMTPRIRFTAVPYAFNAKKVAGLTVTNTTGTFTLANSKTLTVNNTLTFSGTDGTTFTFPSGSGTVVTLDSTGALTNKTLTAPKFADGGFIADSNGNEMLIFDSNASAVNELTISNGATGVGPTIIASGETNVGLTINSKAAGALTLDSGTTGTVNLGISNNAKTINLGTGNAGNTIAIGTNNTVSDTITIGSALDNVAITGDSWSITDAGALTVASCSGCGGGGPSYFSESAGLLSTVNNTLDFSIGGTSTASSKFAVLNVDSGTPTASLSAGGISTYLTSAGTLATTNMTDLTLGGATTGDILLNPRSAGQIGAVKIDGTIKLSDIDDFTSQAGEISYQSDGVGNGRLYFVGQGTNNVIAEFRDCCNYVFKIGGTSFPVDAHYGYAVDGTTVIDGSNNLTNIGTTMTAAAGLAISTTTTGALSLDSGTTGAVNLGTGNNAKTISIGTGNAGNTIAIGTNNTVSDTITIGSALDNVAITGDSWSITDAGALTVVSCSGCGGGSQTPWTSDIDADGFDLGDLSNLGFRETTGAPTGTDVGLFRDNSGDLNLNALSAKSINLQIAGSDEYNFSSSGITMNSNDITGAGAISSTSISLGTTPAAAGTLRLPNNTFITTRNAANSADINLIKVNGSNLVEFGANTAAFTLGGAVTGNSQDLTGLSAFSAGGTITFSGMVTDANAVLYTTTTGVVTRVAETETASQCLLSGSGASGVPTWGSCGGGSQTPWTQDIDADGFDLGDLSNLGFRETTGAPTGTDVGLFRDNTGDLNLNVLTGKSFNIQVNGTDEYNFSSTGLEFNSNNITGLGTNLTAAAGLTIGSGTDANLTLTPGGTGDTIITGDADSNFQLNFGAAPTADMHIISNSGFGTTTDGVDGLYINFVQADDAGVDSNYGLNIDLTAASNDAGEVLGAINLTVTGQTAENRERGITIGSGFDEDIYFASASAMVRIQDGGEIAFTDGSYGGGATKDIPLARIKEYFTGANYGVVESTGFINIDGSFYMENFNRAAPAVAADQTGSSRVIGDIGAWALDERGTGGTTTNATFGCTATPGSTNTSEAVNGVLEIALETSTNTNGTNLTPPWCFISMSSGNGNAVIPILRAANKFIMYYKVKMSSAYTNSVTGNMMWFGAENQTNGGWVGKPTFTGTSTGGIWITNVDGTQTQTGTNATAGTQWIGWARYNGANSTVACSGFNPTSQTSNYALFRIEVRETNNARFFIDGDTSNGVNMTECGSGVTNNIPTRGIRPSMNLGRSFMNTSGTVWTAYVDLFAYVQDDPRDVIAPAGLESEQLASPSSFNPIAGADVAEHYIFSAEDNVEMGDIVSLGDAPGDGDKVQRPYDKRMFGVIAESPGMVLGESAPNSLPVAITGRVPVKVSSKNGPIKIGDPITSSDIPGVGMKATKAGKILGTAMENYDKEEVGKILISISPGYYVSDGEDIGIIENKTELVLNASDSGMMQPESGVNIDSTGSARLTTQVRADQKLQNTMSGLMLFTNGIRVDQILEVMGDAVFYGAVRVEGAAEFLAKVIFRNEVEFEKTVTFNSDSAGYAVIKKGQKFVDVLFESEYKNTPVIHISPTIFKLTDETFKNLVSEGFCLEQEGIEVCQDKLVSTILDGDTRFAVQNQNTQGFLIVLDKEAPVDLTFSWQAVAVKNIKTAENLGPANLMPPYKGSYKITNKYGEHAQDEDIKEKDIGQGLKGHDGYDISLPNGTPIVAVDGGVVESINSDYGVTLVLKHAWGKSVYGHLSKTNYKEGEVVQKGQEIALSGDSGLVTGPHLHFGIKLNNSKKENGYNGFINPNLFISFEEKSSTAVAGVSDSKSDAKKDDQKKLEVKEEEDASTSAKTDDSKTELKD